MKIKIFLACFILNFWINNAQDFKLGKVSAAELEQKSHPKDSSAVAAILFKKGKTFFTYNSKAGFSVNHVVEFRIKIYKKEGLSWANQTAYYYVGYENVNDDKVRFSSAVTYNLEDGKIVKTKLESEGTFKTKINKFWNQATITLPNVKVGSVIEFKYTLESENIVKFPDFDFQYDIPVDFFEYKTEVPEFFIYSSLQKGNLEIETNSELVDSQKDYAQGYKQINKWYSAKNIPALKNEKFVDNKDNYRGAIISELETERRPDWPVKDYAATWEGVAKTIFKDKEFGDELKLKDYFTPDLKVLINKTIEPKEQLMTIFKYVQKIMNWDKKKSYYVDKGVQKAYLERTGNVAEINLMLVSMLRSVGIKSNPVLVSTIDNGLPVFPNRTVFNYVIAAAEIEGKQILMDATNKLTTPNVLPLNVLNWKGRLINEDGSSTAIDLIPSLLSIENFTINAKINLDLQSIAGSVSTQRTNYAAFNFRGTNAIKNLELYLEDLENILNRIEIASYNIQNKSEDLSKPVLENFDFTWNNSYDVIGEKIFINPLLFFTDTKNPFIQDERQMPIYFGFPHRYVYGITLEIPQGYVLESLPKSIRFVTEKKETSYTITTIFEENKVNIMVITDINKAIFAVEDYTMLKDFFQNCIDKQNEKIVLKKG